MNTSDPPCTRCAKKGHQKLLQRRWSQNNEKWLAGGQQKQLQSDAHAK